MGVGDSFSKMNDTNFTDKKRFERFMAVRAVAVCALWLSPALTGLLAESGQALSKMPVAKAESVGMSSEILSRIDERMREHVKAGRIQGAVTAVARRGKVVHFSTHGLMDVKKGRDGAGRDLSDGVFVEAGAGRCRDDDV